MTQYVATSRHKLGPGDSVMITLERSAVPLVDGYIDNIEGFFVRVIVSEPIPEPVNSMKIQISDCISSMTARSTRLFRIDQHKVTFGSKAMRSNIADLLAHRADDSAPVTKVSSSSC